MPRALQYVHALVGLVAVMCYAALVSVLIWPFAPLPRGRRERYTIHGGRAFGWLCMHGTVFPRVQVVGAELLPRDRGYLVISNHRSWVDVALLLVHTWSQGISKKEVAYIPFFGVNGYLTGAIFFDRSRQTARARVVDEALMMMRSGARLHLFPEGTRTRDGRLRDRVHLRLVESCWKAGIDVVPACVWGTERAVPADSFRARPFQPIGIEIAPVLPRTAATDGETYARLCWEKVKEMAARRGVDQPYAESP